MTLDDIEEVTVIRNYRSNLEKLRKGAASGSISCCIWFDGERIVAFDHIGSQGVRDAIVEACTQDIAHHDKRLAELGVEVRRESQP